MKELIKLELRKLSKSKSLYICLAIMLGLTLLSAVAYKILMASAMDLGDLVDMSNTNGISFTLTTLSNADFFIIIGIVIAIIYCFDFEEHTIKNIFARGYSRKSLFFAKVINVLCATIFMFICCFIFAFGVGSIFFGIGEGNLLSMLGLIGVQLLVCLAYSMFFVLISALCKKMAVAIAINIIAPLVVTLLLTVANALIHSDTFSVTNYWLDGMITNLTTLGATTTSIIVAVVGACIYSAIFIALGSLVSKKTEV